MLLSLPSVFEQACLATTAHLPSIAQTSQPRHEQIAKARVACKLWRLTARCLWLSLVLGASANTAARADEIDDYVMAQMSKQHIPGLSIAVLKGAGPVKVRGYGSANLELGTAAAPETVYQIGSISKQFIAAGVVLLSKDGKVSLDESINKYLKDAPQAWRPITVRHVLTHTSGLPRESPGSDLMNARSDADSIREAYATSLAFQPGEKWEYSNLGYTVLAEIISRVARKPWSQYLQERIFAPLGMSATRPTTTEQLVPHRASGYTGVNDQYRNAPIMQGVRPSGAFLSSVLELAKWDAALYSDEPFSSQERELMWTPVKLNDGSDKPYGFGWNVSRVGKHRQLHHAGTMAGFRTQLARFPDDGLTVIVLANSFQALPENIALGVAAFYLPDLLPKRQATKLSTEILDGYTGQYPLSAGRVLNITRREGKLAVTMALGERNMNLGLLTPESNARFFNEDDPRSTYVFVTDEQGRMHLVIENEQGKEVQKSPRLGSGG